MSFVSKSKHPVPYTITINRYLNTHIQFFPCGCTLPYFRSCMFVPYATNSIYLPTLWMGPHQLLRFCWIWILHLPYTYWFFTSICKAKYTRQRFTTKYMVHTKQAKQLHNTHVQQYFNPICILSSDPYPCVSSSVCQLWVKVQHEDRPQQCRYTTKQYVTELLHSTGKLMSIL